MTHNSSSTDKPVALEFPIELEFRNVGFFEEGGKPEAGDKPSEQGREPITNLSLRQDFTVIEINISVWSLFLGLDICYCSCISSSGQFFSDR